MASDLRPNLEINQVFVTANIPEVAAANPEVIFGICRQQVWREKTGSFIGGQVNPSYSFPNLSSGATVEQPGAAEAVFEPHVFIQNKYGIAEVTASYNWALIPPTFDLSPALSATFEISSGTTGAYSATTGKFTDANADFIEDEVAPGDIILVNGIAAFDVVLTVSDVELDVTKRAKVGPFYSGNLSVADLNGDRTFTDPALTTDFVELGVLVGDLIEVAGWAELYKQHGLAFTAGPARTVSNPFATWQTAGVSVFVPGTPVAPASGSQIWLNNGVDWIPTFAVTAISAEDSLTAANLLALWPTAPATGSKVPHEIWEYVGIDLTGGGSYQDATGSWAAGVFSNAAVDFSAILTSPLSEYVLVVHDADGRRPIFEITALGPGPAPILTVNVTPFDSTYPAAGGPGATWEIWQINQAFPAVPLAYYYSAALSAGVGGVHTIILDAAYTTAGADFASIVPAPAAGDLVYDDTGTPLFTIVTVDSNVQITVQDIVAGTMPAGDANFGFRLTDVSNTASVRVTGVSPASLVVRNILTDPPVATAYPALLYSIYVADVLSDLNYTIEKTVTGTALTGDVLVTYMARRNDYSNTPVEVTRENVETLLGPANPANPLGLAAYLALLNSSFSIYALMVPSDTQLDWTNSLAKLESAQYYILCPLTQDEAVLTAARTHVDIQSTPDKKRDRIMWQSHLFERIETRLDRPAGTASYVKTATVTTITIAGIDISTYGAIIGDDFIGVSPACQGRIITMVTGTNSVITIVNANGLSIGAGVINGWKIQSKDLTDEQYADKIAAYPATIGHRRIRNVYPDTCEVTFTDASDLTGQSGFYGGGDVTAVVPAYYVCAMEASKRATVKPAQSLTQYPGAGIHRLLNPFGDPYGGNETLNDRVLDGGNYLMSQPVIDGDCSAVRAISTDTSTLFKMEDSVCVQVDNFARLLRTAIRPLLGPYNIDDLFLDLVSANVNAVRNQILDAKDARAITFLSIREDPDLLDTILLDFEFTPYVAAAKAVITIYV